MLAAVCQRANFSFSFFIRPHHLPSSHCPLSLFHPHSLKLLFGGTFTAASTASTASTSSLCTNLLLFTVSDASWARSLVSLLKAHLLLPLLLMCCCQCVHCCSHSYLPSPFYITITCCFCCHCCCCCWPLIAAAAISSYSWQLPRR